MRLKPYCALGCAMWSATRLLRAPRQELLPRSGYPMLLASRRCRDESAIIARGTSAPLPRLKLAIVVVLLAAEHILPRWCAGSFS